MQAREEKQAKKAKLASKSKLSFAQDEEEEVGLSTQDKALLAWLIDQMFILSKFARDQGFQRCPHCSERCCTAQWSTVDLANVCSTKAFAAACIACTGVSPQL